MLSHRIGASLAVLAMLLSIVVVTPPATAAGSGLAHLPAVTPVMACADIAGLHLGEGVTIQSATVVTTGAPAPYSEVRGTIAPANTIVVWLPVNGWTQRYVQTGCGDLCGNANINYTQAADCAPIADGTIASATTDMGHQGGFDGSWAAHNPQAQIDFSYRGVHATAQVAKALIKAFYHRAPARWSRGTRDTPAGPANNHRAAYGDSAPA